MLHPLRPVLIPDAAVQVAFQEQRWGVSCKFNPTIRASCITELRLSCTVKCQAKSRVARLVCSGLAYMAQALLDPDLQALAPRCASMPWKVEGVSSCRGEERTLPLMSSNISLGDFHVSI